jgi:energy-converting hydrogenase Eha subunit C
MKIAATIFGILIGIFLIVSGTLLPLDIIISILLVCMGAIVITASISYLDYITSYRR